MKAIQFDGTAVEGKLSSYHTSSAEWVGVGYVMLLVLSAICYTYPTWMPTENLFWGLTAILGIHNVLEFVASYRKESRHFWIRPVVIGAIIVFFLQHGALTNFLYRGLDGNFHQPYNDLLVREPFWLTRTMALTLACSVVYWLGYKLNIGSRLAADYYSIFGRFWNFKVSHYAVLLGFLVGIVIKIILNQYGALGHRFGFVLEQAGEIPPILYRLKIFENLSLLFLACMLFLAIQHKRNMLYWTIFGFGFVAEIVFALTTGARSSVLFVFMAAFLVDYFLHGHLRWFWIACGALLLFLAFTVLQDFKAFAMREAKQAAAIKDPLAFIQSANNYRSQLNQGSQDEAAKHALFLTAVGRFNYVNEATQVMRHVQVKGLKPSDPDFLTPFFTFPIFAIVPQYWVLGISTEGYGAWVTDLLVGHKRFDVAMSPIGYSYAAGGAGLVVFVFFVFGFLAKGLETLLSKVNTVMGLIIFLTLFKFFTLFDTVVWAVWLNLIRYGVLLPPVLWLFFKKWK